MIRHGGLAFLLFLALNLAAGPTGFWSADEAVAHQQVDLLADGRWTDPLPAPSLDPDGRWHTSSPLSLGDGVVGPYVKHPLFPAVVYLGDRAAGPIGRFLIPALGSVVAALLIAVGADRQARGSATMSFWLMIIGTPLLFHGGMLWAHSPAVAATAAVFLILQRRLAGPPGEQPAARNDSDAQRATAMVGYAACIAGAVLIRSEAAIFFVLLGLGLMAAAGLRTFGLGRDRRAERQPGVADTSELLTLGLISLVVTLVAFWVDGQLRAAILGPGGDIALDVPPEPLLDWQVRWGLIRRWFIGARPDIGLGMGRIIGMLLLSAAALSARPGGPLSLPPALGLLGGVLYLPGLFTESAVAFAPAAPAVVVGLLALAGGNQAVRFVWALAAVYSAAVVATSYANGGGGDWGGRYLALLLAPLAIIGLPQLWRLGRIPANRPLMVGVVVASVALAFSTSLDVIQARRTTTDLAAVLAEEIDALSGPDDIVVSTDSRIGRLLGTREIDRVLLQVPEESMEELAARLPTGTDLVIVDALARFEVPDGWTVLHSSPYLLRVRPG